MSVIGKLEMRLSDLPRAQFEAQLIGDIDDSKVSKLVLDGLLIGIEPWLWLRDAEDYIGPFHLAYWNAHGALELLWADKVKYE